MLLDKQPVFWIQRRPPKIRAKNTVRFSQYTDVIAAAVAGQGVAIGRFPLLGALLKNRSLVAPFKGAAASQRGYFVAMSPLAANNADAQDFAKWLRAEVVGAALQ